MNSIPAIVLLIGALTTCGCRSHLAFIEEDHVGLKAAFEPNNPSPVQLSIAYRRGVVAVVPQQSLGEVKTTNAANVVVDRTNNLVTVIQDPNELMSLYTRFSANVGLSDPTRVQHFLATGNAASALVANHPGLRNVTTNFATPNP